MGRQLSFFRTALDSHVSYPIRSHTCKTPQLAAQTITLGSSKILLIHVTILIQISTCILFIRIMGSISNNGCPLPILYYLAVNLIWLISYLSSNWRTQLVRSKNSFLTVHIHLCILINLQSMCFSLQITFQGKSMFVCLHSKTLNRYKIQQKTHATNKNEANRRYTHVTTLHIKIL